MERLFTERQWRAVAAVEGCTDTRNWWLHDASFKSLVGPSFVGGDFRLAYKERRVDSRVCGPWFVDYAVCEVASETLFNWPDTDKAEVLRDARELIADIGPELLAWVFAENLEGVAKREAEAVILRARQPKPRKPSKRAKAVFDASEGKCHYCSAALTLDGKWHIEHKMPRALKGGSEMHNLVAACVPCNYRKRDKTDLEFQALLTADGSQAA